MEEQNYYRQSEKYVEFQDTKKGDCKYEIDIEPSKSCIIICLICLFCTLIIAVGIAFALVLPKKKTIPPTTTEMVTTEDLFKTAATTTPEAYVEISEITIEMDVVTYPDKVVVTDDIGFVITEPPEDDDGTRAPDADLLSKQVAIHKKKQQTTTRKMNPGGGEGADNVVGGGGDGGGRIDDTTTELTDQYGQRLTTTTGTPTTSKTHKLLYKIGTAIADMTGPFVELPFLGYIIHMKKPGQGLHTRQFSRAFCFKEGNKTIIYVVAETYAVSHNLKIRVLTALQNVSAKRLGFDLSITNLHIAASGTESAPGCHMIDYFYGYGPVFGEECVKPMVEGIRKSIVRACATAVPARMFYNQADIYYSQIRHSKRLENRPYKANADYNFYPTDFDYVLTQLRIENKFGNIIGLINWSSVRGSSFTPDNKMATSDNIGYAALQLERRMNPGKLVGQAKVVTAFAVSSVADLSPHIDGGRCVHSNKKCMANLDCTFWIFIGPIPIPIYLHPCKVLFTKEDHYQHAESVGNRLLNAAEDALYTRGEELRGPLNAMFKPFVNDDMVLKHYNAFNNSFENGVFKLCKPCLGANFNVVPFDHQDYWWHEDRPDMVKLYQHLQYDIEEIGPDHVCQVSNLKRPINWHTNRFDKEHTHLHPPDATISIINLGGLLVACIPGESSVMAGRRMKKVMGKVMEAAELKPRTVVSGSTNEYIYFITTNEEYVTYYGEEYYLRAMVTYGPRTLDAVLNKLNALARIVIADSTSIHYEIKGLGAHVEHPRRIKNIHSSLPMNMPPRGRHFAEIIAQPPPFIRKGGTLNATFIASNPRVNLRHETSFFVIERRCNKQWVITLRDAEWDTRYHWANMTGILEWKISPYAVEGLYRIRYFAYANKKEFYAVTKNFNIS